MVLGKRVPAESFQQNLPNKPVGHVETFWQTFLVIHVKQFWVPSFSDGFWEPWRVSPTSWRCFVVPWTRNLLNYLTWWKLHRVWISNGSDLLRWFESDILAFEPEISRGLQLLNLQYQKSKKRSLKRKQKRMNHWKRKKKLQFHLLPM